MLIRTLGHEQLVNTSDISATEARDTGDGCMATWATLRDSSTVWLAASLDRLEELAAPVIPAAPGFEFLAAWFDDGALRVERSPILGWRLLEHSAAPIVIDRDGVANVWCAIRFPDGQVEGRGGTGRFVDEAAWRMRMEELHAEYAAEQRAKGNGHGAT